ncbi:hypothetical protein VT98_11803 [Candidatus Electrothrix communis]|uniref:4Fe-4S ferredoxin-type domain-containing protein n=1 Tax=Candidatus Electrothrix communis TaxID=1859133 RepID=A0A3S3UE50_9BACT|nr:hypothetical protein VT98_11803 [Candidatus Electrothrix communis]
MECGACATNCPTKAIYVNPDDGCGCASDHQQMAVQDHEKKSRFGLLLNKSDDQRCGCECEPRIEMVVYKLLRKIADKRGVIGKYNVRNEEFFHCQVRAIKNEIQLTFR